MPQPQPADASTGGHAANQVSSRDTGLPPGVFVVVAGPDGSGKSTLAQALVQRTAGRVLWLHHRPRLLYGRAPAGAPPVTEPYAKPPYATVLSAAKVIYYFLDYALGWWVRARPVLRAGGVVVLERGWFDLRVDPRRYRLQRIHRLVGALGTLLPRPTATLVLDAPVGVLLERTSDDLDRDDLQAQLDAFTREYAGRRDYVVVDASLQREHVERLAVDHVVRLSRGT